MIRCLVSVLALAACALPPSAPAAATAGAGAPEDVHANAEFDLRGTNGFRAEFETYSDHVALTVIGASRYVVYDTPGEVTESGVEARFGRLGQISFRFHPTKTLSSTPPGRGCSGRPWTEKEGFFAGEAVLHGERGYTTIDVQRVKGTLSTSPEWDCPEEQGPLEPGPIPKRLAGGEERREEIGVLRADDGAGHRSFLAMSGSDAKGGSYALFSAGLLEHREGMRIGRGAFATVADAGRFVYDHAAGTATARPPAPFSGHAVFARRGGPKRPGTWRGTLRVSLLGHDPIRLAGREFEATLNRDPPGD